MAKLELMDIQNNAEANALFNRSGKLRHILKHPELAPPQAPLAAEKALAQEHAKRGKGFATVLDLDPKLDEDKLLKEARKRLVQFHPDRFQCTLYKLPNSEYPDLKAPNEGYLAALENRSQYIITKDKLYYYDGPNKNLITLKIAPEKLSEVRKLLASGDHESDGRTLNQPDLSAITALTGHKHETGEERYRDLGEFRKMLDQGPGHFAEYRAAYLEARGAARDDAPPPEQPSVKKTP